MRVAFFGLPLAALALLRGGHEVVLAALCRPNAPGARRVRRLLGEDRVLDRPYVDDPELHARVRDLSPDLLISWFWTTRLPMTLVTSARLGGFGVHPSLLPRWRGPDPYFWAIDAGDEETGVTAHRLEAEYDTGATLGQRRLRIEPHWSSWTLARALDRPSLALLVELADRFSRGLPVPEAQQDASLVTPADAPDEALLELDFQSDATSLVRRVRAAAPYPGAWTFLGEEALVVTRAARTDAPRGLLPGEGAVVDGQAVIATAAGGLALLEGRVVGDDDVERPVDTAAIAAILAAANTPTLRDSE